MARSRRRAANPVERFQHGDQVFRWDRFLLLQRRGMPVAAAGYQRDDRPIFAIQRHTALHAVPTDGGEAAVNGGNAVGLAPAAGCANGTA